MQQNPVQQHRDPKGRAGTLHVPYRGGGPALTDLLGSHVQVMFDTLVTSIGHIKAGELRPLGVTSETRVEVFPDVPAIGKFVPGYVAVDWQGIAAPINTPQSRSSIKSIKGN